MGQVKVSVIIPVYNGAAYIRECMDSIVCQTLKEIEIIPVDAGSTDGTVEILQEYAKKDSRIKLLFSDKKSMGYQTNRGISAAKGEYIGFCEADDYLAPTMYERLYEMVSENCLDYVKSDFDMFVDHDERMFLRYRILDGGKADLYGSVICPRDMSYLVFRDVNMWNGIYKRAFIKQNNIRLNETPKAAFQDMGFVLQTLLLADKAMYVREEANRYRRDNVNSSVYDQKSLLFVTWELEYFYAFLMAHKIEGQEILAAVLKRFLTSFCEYYGRLPGIADLTEEVRHGIESFRQILRKFYALLEYGTRSLAGLDCILDLKLLLEEDSFFDAYRRQKAELDRKYLREFYSRVCKSPKTVIFGAGECGTACYAMLRHNSYKGTLCFCDNNEALWNKDVMGLKVLSLEKVLEAYGRDVLFLLANVEHWQDMYHQLRSFGIEDSVCKAVSVGPHAAFETKLPLPV